MARKLFDPGIYSVLTSGGAIGVGWGLAFYSAGTTTAITTYNAQSGGSPNAASLTSDANGRFPPAWINQGQSIKFVFSDDQGVPKVTLDNFPIAADPPTIDASLDTFLAASAALPIANGGTGATSAPNALTALGALPAAGGTVTGNITRNTKGCHVYFHDAAMVNPEVFITASAASDPRSGLPGQIWLKY